MTIENLKKAIELKNTLDRNADVLNQALLAKENGFKFSVANGGSYLCVLPDEMVVQLISFLTGNVRHAEKEFEEFLPAF